jgi:hypothetical protein
MLSKKDFRGFSEQHRFKMSVESANSIQKVNSDDSIVACQQVTADFSDSIDRSRTSLVLRKNRDLFVNLCTLPSHVGS